MSEREPSFESQPLNLKKESRWNNMLETIETDLSGVEGIEREIKEPVVALNAVGLPTTNSCEGHDNHGRIVPWVSVGAPNMPTERCVGQKEFEQKIYEENGVSKDLLKKEKDYSKEYEEEMRKLGIDNLDGLHERLLEKYNLSNEDLETITQTFFKKVLKGIDKAVNSGILEETPEYVHWKEENKKLFTKASEFLEEFYQGREVAGSVKLVLDGKTQDCSGFLIRNEGGGDYINLDNEMTERERADYEDILAGRIPEKKKDELRKHVETYRAEFKEFAEFLKKKFFES